MLHRLRRQQKAELAEKLKAKAEELAQEFKDQWQPVAENLDRAMKAFDDLEGAALLQRLGMYLGGVRKRQCNSQHAAAVQSSRPKLQCLS